MERKIQYTEAPERHNEEKASEIRSGSVFSAKIKESEERFLFLKAYTSSSVYSITCYSAYVVPGTSLAKDRIYRDVHYIKHLEGTPE